MHRPLVGATLACATFAAIACSSSNSTSPTDRFSGTYIGRWAGTTGVPDTIHITQPGASFTGTDIEVAAGGEAISLVTGSEHGDSVTFVLTQNGIPNNYYSGAFTSPTVVDGYMRYGTDSVEVTWTHN